MTELESCKTREEIEKFLDDRDLSYTISKDPYDLIEDYAASDAFSTSDVEGLLAMGESDLIDRFRLFPFGRYVFVSGYHIFIFD